MGTGPVAVTILGSTGTIGENTLDVIARHPGRYRVFALTACSDDGRLLEQCIRHRPEVAVMVEPGAAKRLSAALRENGLTRTRVLAGAQGLEEAAASPGCDAVMAAIVGAAGLLPTLAAARAGKRILLANKESLVMAGGIFMDAVREGGALLLPVDSEHNAVWQCLPEGRAGAGLADIGVKRIMLTASGGPFRDTPAGELESVTPEQACAHPNWRMGRKISVDSATMMNKGLELIEACWLFNTRPEFIDVVLHPQSVVHSMVAYNDGSVLAQLGNPDMRTPIAHALAWPERVESGVEPLNLFEVASLSFQEPDFMRFPCLKLAIDAARAGGTSTAVLNAANEVAVARFLERRIRFTGIAEVVGKTLEKIGSRPADTLELVLEDDRRAREHAERLVAAA